MQLKGQVPKILSRKTLNRNKNLTSIKGYDIVSNKLKNTGNNSNLDLVNINAYIKFGEFLSICSQDSERKRNFGYIKGHNSGTNLRKMTCNNPRLDLANMNAYMKFGENICQLVLKILSGNEIWRKSRAITLVHCAK